MQFDFMSIIDALNQNLPRTDNFAWRMARAAVTPGDYLFNSILPDQNRPDFNVDGGTMTITPTMLQGVNMDTPFPPMGAISASQFFENTTKVGGQMFFTEKQQRDLDSWVKSITSTGLQDGLTVDQINGPISINENGRADENTVNGRRMNAVLGVAQMIIQAHWDTREYLKGKALCYGKIQSNDFAFAGSDLVVDYKLPASSILTARTGNDAYKGSASKFWTDVRTVYKNLRNVRLIMNSTTYYSIVDNTVNSLIVADQSAVDAYGFTARVRKYDQSKASPALIDQRDTVTITVYNRSGSVLKNDAATKKATLQAVPFLPDGKIIAIGDANVAEISLTAGAVQDPANGYQLGYNHIAPTVEGQFRPGVWSRVFTPEAKPWALQAETASNFLPVILGTKRLNIMTTEV